MIPVPIIFFAVVILIGIIYRRAVNKHDREFQKNDFTIETQNEVTRSSLKQSIKPILWVHVPKEKNDRVWDSFNSRNSNNLNQPYLMICLKSIIEKCNDSFTICLVDDNSFHKLLPNWKIDFTKPANPILSNLRQLGMMKLLQTYGGMVCPISFLCLRNMKDMYDNGTRNGNMFACEIVNHSITSVESPMIPTIRFCGAPLNNGRIRALVEYLEHAISVDFTGESGFTGAYDNWLIKGTANNSGITIVSGSEIGTQTKSPDNQPIHLSTLMSNDSLNPKLDEHAYGILIPASELLKSNKYAWFAYLSESQVMDAHTSLSDYFLLERGSSLLNNPYGY
jgi:hypothetical protein